MKESSILITGSQGFLGGHLHRVLSEGLAPDFRLNHEEIIRLGRKSPGEFPCVDMTDRAKLTEALEASRPRYIFHLAGRIYSNDLDELHRENVQSTINLLEAVKTLQIPTKVIIPGSASEYGLVSADEAHIDEERALRPISPYGLTKSWQTALAKYYDAQGLDVVVGRVFNVVGRNASVHSAIEAFARQIRQIQKKESAPEIRVGNLTPKRDYIDVTDACLGLISLAKRGQSGEAYNICSGQAVSMRHILDLMVEASGLKVKITVDPAKFRIADIMYSCGSHRKITVQTGWRPHHSLAETIGRFMAEEGLVGK